MQEFLSDINSLCILGCGSSFSIAKSSALQFSQKTGIPAYAIAAGDMLVNFKSYQNITAKSTLILLSRSGSTSELLLVAERCRASYPGIKILSICAVENAPIASIADINIEIPWAFDESVCQTRTVSNLYVSALLISSIIAGDIDLQNDLLAVKEKSILFINKVEDVLKDLAEGIWENAVVLADSGMAGIAEEGVLAFKEICQRNSNFYHVLDVRHGPIVTIDSKSLVIVLVSSGEQQLQSDLVKDISKTAGITLALYCTEDGDPVDGVTRIMLPECVSDDVSSIFMLYCIQLICLHHALLRGVNPDDPKGLTAWIELNS
ncbi:MAG: SIS domain-containing protein [Sporomusa sp.]